jgi:putative glycosyltransferase (TIGR04348 family)
VRVALICPAPKGSRLGNRITANRWQELLREMGHDPFIAEELGRRRYDLLVALHARKSASAVRASRERAPATPVVVALTGTDLYRDIQRDAAAQRSLRLADLLIVLHDRASKELPAAFRDKVRVVPQSAPPTRHLRAAARFFEVAVVGHLRAEKDPFRTALAARMLPRTSRVRVLHAGRALSAPMRERALQEQRANPRYRWLGELSPARSRSLIARSRLLSLTSEIEGGANVLSEALASDTAVVSSRIPCSEAILGEDYPGLFRLRSTRALSLLLHRAEVDAGFLRELKRLCRKRRPVVSRAREKKAWRDILRESGRLTGTRTDASSGSSTKIDPGI